MKIIHTGQMKIEQKIAIFAALGCLQMSQIQAPAWDFKDQDRNIKSGQVKMNKAEEKRMRRAAKRRNKE